MRHSILPAVLVAWAAAPAPAVDFRRDVHPILAEHCLLCHGPDDAGREGKLRLDARDDALRGGRSGEPGVVPGKPDESEFVRRVASTDADDVMPPPRHGKPLSAAQVATLRAWVAAGAPYDGHWTFTPPRRPAPPPGPAHPVDSFVAARLAHSGIRPTPPAAPEALSASSVRCGPTWRTTPQYRF